MDLKSLFDTALNQSKSLPNQSNENLLLLYGLFKQASEGDVSIEKPTNMFDFKGIAKYNAWAELKGLRKEEAMQKYVDLVETLGK